VPVMITEETSIDYDVHGEGPPLVLIGGLGFGRWGFFKQVPAFSRHFRTITFDVRGEQDLDSGVADLTANVVALLVERSEEVNREVVTFLKPRNPQKRRGREGHRPRTSGAKL
jgi:hypothetical protein